MTSYIKVYAIMMVILLGLTIIPEKSEAGITCNTIIGYLDESYYYACSESSGCLNHDKLATQIYFDYDTIDIIYIHYRCIASVLLYNPNQFALPQYKILELSPEAERDADWYTKTKFYVLWDRYATGAESLE